MCKDEHGEIVPWAPALNTTFRSHTQALYRDRGSPLHRVSELFNVNHFIVSQARPYLAPFLRSDLHHPNPKQDGRWRFTMPFLHLGVREIQHRLQQLDQVGLLPLSIRRFLLDENIPGPSLTLVPELDASDFFKLLENPTKEAVDYWILKGERSVWPAVTAIKIRCAIEVELDRGYQLVRRRRPSDDVPASAPASAPTSAHTNGGASSSRASSSRTSVEETGSRITNSKASRRSRRASDGGGL